jgi:hypothetical protein
MAWDSKTSRRRQNSNAAVAKHASMSTATLPTRILPKSSHVADPQLQAFLSPSFDAADFLNSTLPHLNASGGQSKGDEVNLAELSTQTQTLLSHLSAHTTRLTNTLTQLTDEILRSGSRLAYEVEVLRGETLGLSEALTEGLQDDISKFVPIGIEQDLARRPSRTVESDSTKRRSSMVVIAKPAVGEGITIQKDPEYIAQLRTLTLVRTRLDTVIKTFGDAMSWTFPPSEVSVSSAFLSVSAPELGSDAHSTEEKGQQVSKKLRDEIADLLLSSGDPVDGIEAAAKRVEELKQLAMVWRGTAEEKARTKFVESLAKMVEDRHRDLLREAELDSRNAGKGDGSKSDTVKSADSGSAVNERGQSGYGFINQLQKMRGGL